jgi:CHAT domain-containing protein
MLMREFYQALAQPDRSMTKAKALQEAQLVVLSTSQYRDPYYWAPYLLIGNWR